MKLIKQPSKRELSAFVISLWLLTSCATVPPDVPVFEGLDQHVGKDPVTGHVILKPSPTCVEKIGELECGHGVYIVSGKEIYVGEDVRNQLNHKGWKQLKSESILVPAQESYAPLATYIINACKKLNCNAEIDKFKVKLNSLATAPNVGSDSVRVINK